jgi:hypothetical protein
MPTPTGLASRRTEMRLIVPARPSRAALRAFWLTMSVWGGLGTALLVPLDVVSRLAVGVLVAALIVLGAWLCPRDAKALYRLWARASRLHARITRLVLLRLCHGVVFVAVGRAGSTLKLAPPRPDESLWVPRSTLASAAYRSQFEATNGTSPVGPWMATATWSMRSGNLWTLALVPFLALIAALETEDRQRFPAGIYTLF